jgi:hypothetical protein
MGSEAMQAKEDIMQQVGSCFRITSDCQCRAENQSLMAVVQDAQCFETAGLQAEG